MRIHSFVLQIRVIIRSSVILTSGLILIRHQGRYNFCHPDTQLELDIAATRVAFLFFSLFQPTNQHTKMAAKNTRSKKWQDCFCLCFVESRPSANNCSDYIFHFVLYLAHSCFSVRKESLLLLLLQISLQFFSEIIKLRKGHFTCASNRNKGILITVMLRINARGVY